MQSTVSQTQFRLLLCAADGQSFTEGPFPTYDAAIRRAEELLTNAAGLKEVALQIGPLTGPGEFLTIERLNGSPRPRRQRGQEFLTVDFTTSWSALLAAASELGHKPSPLVRHIIDQWLAAHGFLARRTDGSEHADDVADRQRAGEDIGG